PSSGPSSYGIALLENFRPGRAVTAARPALQIAADGQVTPANNINVQYMTIPGTDSTGRLNNIYTEVDGEQGVLKTSNRRFNLVYQFNCKSDTETAFSTQTGRVGNWRARYTVGDEGNVVLVGSANGAAPDPAGQSWLGEYWPAATYNVGFGNVTWTNNQSGVGNPG